METTRCSTGSFSPSDLVSSSLSRYEGSCCVTVFAHLFHSSCHCIHFILHPHLSVPPRRILEVFIKISLSVCFILLSFYLSGCFWWHTVLRLLCLHSSSSLWHFPFTLCLSLLLYNSITSLSAYHRPLLFLNVFIFNQLHPFQPRPPSFIKHCSRPLNSGISKFVQQFLVLLLILVYFWYQECNSGLNFSA